uniref:Glycosyltransferase, putative n=1 Tax=Arundo donax TaxID=35708 RepID=A0A0A9ESX7_ARUDO
MRRGLESAADSNAASSFSSWSSSWASSGSGSKTEDEGEVDDEEAHGRGRTMFLRGWRGERRAGASREGEALSAKEALVEGGSALGTTTDAAAIPANRRGCWC